MRPSGASPRYFYGWNIAIVGLLMNIAASPTNAVAFSFFVSPMSEDLGWSRGSLALALTFRLVVAGVTSPIMGMLVDRIGARVLGALAGAITGLTMIALYWVNDLWMLYLLFAISGLSGFGGPAGQLLTTVPVAKWFHARRGRALAIASMGIPIGVTAFIPIIQGIIALTDWRTAWVVSGVIVILFSVPVCLLLMRKDPESIGLYPDGMSKEEYEAATATPTRQGSSGDWTVSEAVRTQSFWMLISFVGLTGLVIQGTLIYRTSFWEDSGVSDGILGFATALDPFTVLFSGLFFGFLAERVAARYVGFAGSLAVAASMVPMMLASGAIWNIFAHNIIWGLAMGANITVNNIIWPNYFGRAHLGSIRGMMFPVAIGSAALSAPLFALLIDVIPDTRWVWGFTFGAYIIAALLILSSRPPRRRRQSGPRVTVAAGESA